MTRLSDQRRAAALRENLKRRKAGARPGEPVPAQDAPPERAEQEVEVRPNPAPKP